MANLARTRLRREVWYSDTGERTIEEVEIDDEPEAEPKVAPVALGWLDRLLGRDDSTQPREEPLGDD